MDYDPTDSSGTDDDLPPQHQNRVARGGRVAPNGRPAIAGTLSYNPRGHTDMETQIHRLEQEAYSAVLRAFKAQSDAITWEKESLITELRKELRVSDEEHRELLGRVNADDIIRRIREWRQSGGMPPGMLSTSQPAHDVLPSPSVSLKKQKTSQTIPPSLSTGVPSPALPQQPTMQPSSSMTKRPAPGGRSKKPKSGPPLVGVPSMKYPAPGAVPGQVGNRGASVQIPPNDPNEAYNYSLVGRKVATRWPDDNNFYDAEIISYDHDKGEHVLVYDKGTTYETYESVNLKKISPEDIRWEGEDTGISHRPGRGGPGRGNKKPTGRGTPGPGVGRGRGQPRAQSKKDFPPSQNGIGKKIADDIEILHTDTLIKEVERVFGSSHPDPVEIEKAKKVLKDHEQSLIDAIARLADASDGESEEGEHPFSHGQSIDRDGAWRNRQYGGGSQRADFDDGLGVGGRGDGSEGDRRMAAQGRGGGSDDQLDGEEADEDI